jgi:uncharacterized delta-60 repeat protein
VAFSASTEASVLKFDAESKCPYASASISPSGNYYRTCYGEPSGVSPPVSFTVLVEKFSVDGKLDPAWGIRGLATAVVSAMTNCAGKEGLPQIFFPPDGRILSLAGSNKWSVVAFAPNGSVDREYGNEGISDPVCPFPAPLRPMDSDYILSVDMLNDGRLVTVANSRVGTKYPGTAYFATTRLATNGKLDTTFGRSGSGRAQFIDMPESANSEASRVVAWSLQRDGSFQASYFFADANDASIVLKSQDDNGSDTSTTIAGRAFPQRGVNYFRERDGYIWQHQPDGGLLFKLRSPIGQVYNGSGEPVLIRLQADGQLDRTFGVNGRLFVRPPALASLGAAPVNCQTYNYLSPGVIQVDGSVVFEGRFGFGNYNTGWAPSTPCGSPKQFDYVVKLLPNGNLSGNFPQWNTPTEARGLYSKSTPEWTAEEYYNPKLKRYFMTPHPGEQAAIEADDALRNSGWRKTGRRFGVWDPDYSLVGTASACRFAADPIVPPKSFYDSILDRECDMLREQELATLPGQRAWRYDRESFRATPPVNAVCPSTLVPIYSLYNQGHERGIDSNFRYVNNLDDFNAMIDRGWVGLAQPQFCARPD